MSSPPIKRRDLKPAEPNQRRSRTPNSIYLVMIKNCLLSVRQKRLYEMVAIEGVVCQFEALNRDKFYIMIGYILQNLFFSRLC